MHDIPLMDETPVFLKQYKIPQAYREAAEKEVDKMVKMGLLEESRSCWNMPIVVVLKSPLNNNDPEGPSPLSRVRIALDCRAANARTKNNFFALPEVSDLFTQLKGDNHYFSSFDLPSGFHQVRLTERAKDICSFTLNARRYRYCRIANGLATAPFTFSLLMSRV